MGPDAAGYVGSLGGSFVLPPFFLNELLGGTSPGELEGSATPPPPNADTNQRTFWHPYAIPFVRWTGPPYSPAPWWQGSSVCYLHTIAPANHDN